MKNPPRIPVLLVLVGMLMLPLSPTRAERADRVRTESFRLLNEGVAAYKNGDFPAAVEKLRTCAAMALNSFRAHYYLGLALIGDRRYGGAVEALTVALDLDPTHLQAHVALGDAHLKQGDTGEAMAEYYRALKLRPEFAAALDGLARVHESMAEDDKAVTMFRRAIASNKGFADAYTHLGDLYLRRGLMDEAVRLLAEAVSIRPDFAPGLNRLALAYGRLGLANEAVATIRKAIELEPKSASHRAALGRIHLSLGLLANAEKAFEEAVQIDPALPEARAGMAELARRRGFYEEAFQQIEIALADPRIDARTARRLEEFRAEIEAERVRLEELEQRVADGEAAPEDHRALARIYAGRGLWEEACGFQENAPPTDSDRELLAYMLFQAGRYREAHGIYADLAGRAPRPELEVNNGVTLTLLGDHARALEAYERALDLDPENLAARLYMANTLMRLGRQDEAVEAYQRFLLGGGHGESEERVRRILEQVAPDAVPSSGPPALAPQPAASSTEEESAS